MQKNKWPKTLPPLNDGQQKINDEFMQEWHANLTTNPLYSLFEKFNHDYSIKHAPKTFLSTLEIGAGLGEHITQEKLTLEQKQNYVALDMRENMAAVIQQRHPEVKTLVGNCQETLPFDDNHFERIIGIHVLEHLTNLPAALKEMHRVCNKEKGTFSVVIPCEGGLMHQFARRISAQRAFEKKYKQPYKWFIEREHINLPHEILEEISKFFAVAHQTYFPLIVPSIHLNLCLGLTLRPLAI
jgi:ubiquinone/menaquinone biosynthesis C-methylase UbiE